MQVNTLDQVTPYAGSPRGQGTHGEVTPFPAPHRCGKGSASADPTDQPIDYWPVHQPVKIDPRTSLSMNYLREFYDANNGRPGLKRRAKHARHLLLMHWSIVDLNYMAGSEPTVGP